MIKEEIAEEAVETAQSLRMAVECSTKVSSQ